MPQRFLRPGITESDPWNSCSFEGQSMYIRLLTLVDDYGRYDGRIAVLHAHCFALRPDIKPQRTATLRSELHANKLIRIYVVDRKEYVQILRWKEHARGTRSKYPSENDNPQESAADRSEAQESVTSLVPRSSIIVPSSLDQATARNGEHGSHSSFKKPTLSEAKTYGVEIGMSGVEVESWYDHFESNGWKVGGKTRMSDWKAALRNGNRRKTTEPTSTSKSFGERPKIVDPNQRRIDEEYEAHKQRIAQKKAQ